MGVRGGILLALLVLSVKEGVEGRKRLGHVTVKVLAQQRVEELSRLLESLEGAVYPSYAVVDVEIHVDGVADGDREAKKRRKAAVKTAEEFAARRPLPGAASVVKAPTKRGVRGAWLACSDPTVFGEELGRVLVVEDDVVLSEAWHAFLEAAVDVEPEESAGVSLQRQAKRLDAYADELGLGDNKKRTLAPLVFFDTEEDDEAFFYYSFPHVGSWAFSPRPKTWLDFKGWLAGFALREKKKKKGSAFETTAENDPAAWSVGLDLVPYAEAGDVALYVETLPSRWFRRALLEGGGDDSGRWRNADPASTWTAHFDAYCAARGLMVLHAHAPDGLAFAASSRADGEHYRGRPSSSQKKKGRPDDDALFDSPTATWKDWVAMVEAKGSTPKIPRLALSGRRLDAATDATRARRLRDARTSRRSRHGRSSSSSRKDDDGQGRQGRRQGRRRLEDEASLNAFWAYDDPEAASFESASALLDGLAYGEAPVRTLSRSEALCVLSGKKVAILGDSISRYFTFTMNYFLEFGVVPPEYDEDASDTEWAYVSGSSNVWVPTEPESIGYYDRGEIWGSSDDPRRTGRPTHRQWITATRSDGINSVDTSFWFVQDTWYEPLATLSEDTIVPDYDVLVVNSAWWELLDNDDVDPDLDDTDCGAENMYLDEDCLEAYDGELRDGMYDNLLSHFQADGKAVVWRTANCCGNSYSASEVDNGDLRRGAVAVAAMNVVADQAMADNRVNVVDVSPMVDAVNVGVEDQVDDWDRTFDSSHPRAYILYLWFQLVLNDVGDQLGRLDECTSTPAPTTLKPTPGPTLAPTTPGPSWSPTARPTDTLAPTAASCSNGVADAGETDVDCGGLATGCPRCALGLGCAAASDCAGNAECFANTCVLPPTPSPTPSPTPTPTLSPTTSRPSSSPTPGATVSFRPTSSPTPRPTPSPGGQPVEDDDCDDSDYGSNCNVRPPDGGQTFTIGNTTFVCPLGIAANDGVRYDRRGSELHRIFGDNCPTTGQRMLLALLLAAIVAFCLAWLRWYDAYSRLLRLYAPQSPVAMVDPPPPPPKLFLLLSRRRRPPDHASSGGGDVYRNRPAVPSTNAAEPPSSSKTRKGPPQAAAAASTASAPRRADDVKLEDKLSNSALAMLHHMEAQEAEIQRRRSSEDLPPISEEKVEDSSKDRRNGTSGELAPINEEKEGIQMTEQRSGTGNGPSHAAGGGRGSQKTLHTSSYYARTTQTKLSQRLSTFSASVPLDQRSSRYSEPFSHPGSSHFSSSYGGGGRASSVAFSLYDGGDSDDDQDGQDDDEGLVALAPDEEQLASGGPSAEEVDAKRRYHDGTEALAAAGIALELALVLLVCVVGEHRMPAGILPAGSRLLQENIDLWTFIMMTLGLVSIIKLKIIDDGSGKPVDPKATIFLSRAQANEFKGWMQIAFVAYHYTNAQDVYVPIRWFVSAYLWISSFGNGVYFFQSSDFTLKRLLQQNWRINFLSVLLSLATGTPWIDYYFVAVATLHFLLNFLCCGAVRLFCGGVLGWPGGDKRAGREVRVAEKALCVVVLGALVVAVWYDGQPDTFGSGGVVYRRVFQSWMREISPYLENNFWRRSKMDYLSGVSGLVFAAFYRPLHEMWPAASLSTRLVFLLGAGVGFAAAVYVSDTDKFCCRNGLEYRRLNAYVGTLWIPAYWFLRNLTPWLANRIAVPMEHIGMHSLEFYLLQFHVFLTHRSQLVLYIIPKENWALTNMVLVGVVYYVLIVKSLEITNVTRAIVWKASRTRVAVGAAWVLAFYVTFAVAFSDRDTNICSPTSWGVWAIFFVVAVACLAAWVLAIDITHLFERS